FVFPFFSPCMSRWYPMQSLTLALSSCAIRAMALPHRNLQLWEAGVAWRVGWLWRCIYIV
ncbi:Os08g0159900, partial [Oryza sativa Japonica Group]